MSKICPILNVRPARGRKIIRKGKAKKKGGIGLHTTGNTPRLFLPNIRNKKLFIPELAKKVNLRLSARALKTLMKKGTYTILKEKGLI
ncbi:50S ribosomal protein L28 [Methylacidiphilum caldifontis]|uniref:Large ribosomal subunit protein bL28 n=1 Tax=Methylacidiphilum caldifontis TaxID=2795386 RepID=A0A4Y8PCG0_9BACT|nr:50S ribosomal protein L28 [Methylacidiphilum caldifontis]QSR89020.1 50S ribosomal protein L28 [Methylacidiphilum caldifontis]TFE68617.1 50S ribosomal protein L28 [Methylacidiphilum caldifontis]